MARKQVTDPRKFVRWFSIEGFIAITVIIVAVIQSALTLLGFIPFDNDGMITINIAILGVLSSMSVSNLVRIANQAKSIEMLSSQAQPEYLPKFIFDRRNERKNPEDVVNNANEVFICDPFLTSFSLDQHIFVKLLESSCDITVITLDPTNDQLLKSIADNSSLDTLLNLESHLKGTISNIANISRSYGQNPTEGRPNHGMITLKFFNGYFPITGICSLYRKTNESKIMIELSPYKFDELEIHRYSVLLHKRSTPDIFSSYKKSFDKMVLDSSVQQLTNFLPPPYTP